MRLSIVLCEGYDDRSFWSGWLDVFQINRVSKAQEKLIQASGYGEGKGEYALAIKPDDFVILRQVNGEKNLLRHLKSILHDRPKYAVDRVVISVDPDTVEGDSRTGLRLEDVLREVKAFDPNAAIAGERGVALFDGAVTVSLVRWEVLGATPSGVPEKQTLERLVCRAIQAAYPERAEGVAAWLLARRDPPRDSGKAFSWSYMAGWFPENGCDDFFRAVWRDEKIAAELRKLLEVSGAWAIATALAE